MTILKCHISSDPDLIFLDPRVISWLSRFSLNVDSVTSVTAVGAIFKEVNVLYSVLLEVNFSYAGRQYTRSILVRGPAAVVIVLIRGNQLADSRYLVVRQVRVCNGKETYEFPSGGLDGRDSLRCILTELEEETGITAKENALKMLRREVVVCESAMDELADWYLLEVSQEDIRVGDFGNAEDNERTRTEIISWSELTQINSFHMMAARNLIEEHFLRGQQ